MEPNRGLLTKIYSLNTAISLEPNNAHEIPSAYQITSTRHPLTPRKKKTNYHHQPAPLTKPTFHHGKALSNHPRCSRRNSPLPHPRLRLPRNSLIRKWVRDKVRQGYTYEAKWLWCIKLKPAEFTRRRAVTAIRAAVTPPSKTDNGVSMANMEMGGVQEGLITIDEIVWSRRLW